ncbi:MAG: FHA domain-containing protein [Gammaproteobacteria bacterium]|nr:FHA domain-containing protein [Gammaproteobacteria bacterium]
MDESATKDIPKGWYCRTREGAFGPFSSREVANNLLFSKVKTVVDSKPGVLQRLVNVLTPPPEDRRGSPAEIPPPIKVATPPRSKSGSLHGAGPVETDAFDYPAKLCHPMASDKYLRLPYNKTEDLKLARGNSTDIYLASYHFRLEVSLHNLRMVDNTGKTHLLCQGTSTIGRNTNNDIVTDRSFTEISRYHLIIDWNGDDVVQLTDTSSLGTFVIPKYLAE